MQIITNTDWSYMYIFNSCWQIPFFVNGESLVSLHCFTLDSVYACVPLILPLDQVFLYAVEYVCIAALRLNTFSRLLHDASRYGREDVINTPVVAIRLYDHINNTFVPSNSTGIRMTLSFTNVGGLLITAPILNSLLFHPSPCSSTLFLAMPLPG